MDIKKMVLGDNHRDVAIGYFNNANLAKDREDLEGMVANLNKAIAIHKVYGSYFLNWATLFNGSFIEIAQKMLEGGFDGLRSFWFSNGWHVKMKVGGGGGGLNLIWEALICLNSIFNMLCINIHQIYH